MAETITSEKLGRLERAAVLDVASLTQDARTVSLSFSSEAPVLRRDWDGERYYEILDHAKVNSRDISDGAPLLFGHSDMHHIGTVESVSFDGVKGRAVVRFGRSALAEEKFNDVKDGILKKTSVGYDLSSAEPTEDGKRDGIPVIRFKNWKPMEVTLCPLPADNSVGVGREQGECRTQIKLSEIMKRNLLLDATVETAGNNSAAVITKEDFSRELDEAREIVGIQSHYQRTHPGIVDLCEKAIRDKMPIRDFQRKVIEIVSKPAEQTAVVVSTGSVARKDNSLGARFVNSDSYKRAIKNGKIGSGNHIHVEMPEVTNFARATTFGIGTSDISSTTDLGGGSGANIDINREWNRLNQQPITVAQMLGQGTTTGDNVRFIRELTFTNDATRVAEAAAKPQASLDFGVRNATVEKTSVLLKVTEEMLADWAQAASVINESLGYMVADKEDGYLLNGTGSSEITGLYNTTGLQTTSGAANTIDVFKRAKALVEGASGTGFASCDAFILNPLDWLSISLTKDGNGQYLFGGPGYAPYGVGGYSNVSMMWGVPVVTTVRNTQGQAICGALRNGATQWRRAGISIRTTDSDGTDFLNGIVTVCADARMTLTVKQPGRFCTITSIPLTV